MWSRRRPRSSTPWGVSAVEERSDSHEDHPPSGANTESSVEVFDSFAGCGGFSTGAVMAGATVA